MLKTDALLLRLFQVFGEAAPWQMKSILRILILKSLVLNNEFNLKQSSEKDILSLIEERRDFMAQEASSSNPSESLKKLVEVVAYTVIMSANGHAANKYLR